MLETSWKTLKYSTYVHTSYDSWFPQYIVSKRTNKKILPISIILFPLLIFTLNYAFGQSGYPVSFSESQLSCSGEEIKSHYHTMTTDQIQLYVFVQIIDYFYLIIYGLLILSIGLNLGRKLSYSLKAKSGFYYISIAKVTAVCCNAIENAFILSMESKPLQFNNLLDIIHSVLPV